VSVSVTTKLSGSHDVGVTNAIPVSTAQWELYFPFSPNGPQGSSNWKTFLGIANLATQTQTIALSFIPDGNSNDSGPVNPPGTPVTVLRNLPVGGTFGDSVASLFALPSDKFTAGWIHVFGSGPLAGAVAYQDSTAGSLATIPSQTSGSSRFF